MSPEAQLLGAVDSLVTLAISACCPVDSGPEDAPPAPAAVRVAASRIERLAHGLELAETAAAAQAFASAYETGLMGRQDLENLLEAIVRSADSGLERRILAAQAGSGESSRGDQEPQPGMAVTPSIELVDESLEHLDAIEQQLLALEADPEGKEALHAIFRGFHTIKGLAAVFEAVQIRNLAHEVETLLDKVREGTVGITAELIDLVLQSADTLRSLLNGAQTAPPLDLLSRIEALSGVLPAAVPLEPNKRAAQTTHPVRAAIKVDTAKLDQLVNLVGELVIAQSQVESSVEVHRRDDPRLAKNLSQLARMAAELQKAALGMRLVPLGPAFQRLARAFRDLVRQSGKQALLEVSGEEIELDRTILEQLSDALVHMVRNAVDHGLESPEARLAVGKHPVGKLRLAASHRAGHVVIEVSDDGRGLDPGRIRRRAIERGLVSNDAELSTAELLELIFLPGFSTADRVTDLSGRGVGMDVVQRQIERLRGHVEVRSEPGVGTSFFLRLPLTLAVIDGLLVRVGDLRYIFPLFAVKEMFRPAPGSITTLENLQEVALVRGHPVPVLRLRDLLGLGGERAGAANSILVLTEWTGRPCCLMVDEILGKQEVVMKSLGDWFGHMRGVSGGAILSDGTVGLILDPEGLLGGTFFGAAA